MDADQRLRSLEERIEAIEDIIGDAKTRFEAFAKGPGRKILAVLGITP